MSINKEEEENCCFICFEFKLKRERKPKRLKDQNLYIKTCECDGFIHNICLKTWYISSGKCPICREFMFNSKNEVVTVLVNMNVMEQNENTNNTNNTNNVNNIIVRNENMGIRMRIYVYIQRNWNKVAAYSNILFILFMLHYYLISFNESKNILN
jgi:hypothetical protein